MSFFPSFQCCRIMVQALTVYNTFVSCDAVGNLDRLLTCTSVIVRLAQCWCLARTFLIRALVRSPAGDTSCAHEDLPVRRFPAPGKGLKVMIVDHCKPLLAMLQTEHADDREYVLRFVFAPVASEHRTLFMRIKIDVIPCQNAVTVLHYHPRNQHGSANTFAIKGCAHVQRSDRSA